MSQNILLLGFSDSVLTNAQQQLTRPNKEGLTVTCERLPGVLTPGSLSSSMFTVSATVTGQRWSGSSLDGLRNRCGRFRLR